MQCDGRRRMCSRRSDREAAATPRRARSSGDDRPRWADAAETGRGRDQGRGLVEFKLPYVAFTQVELHSLLQPRAAVPARASPAKSRSRAQACPLPERPGSQLARYQRQAQPAARQPHGPARRRTERQRCRHSTTPRMARPSVVPTRHRNINLRPKEAAFGCGQPGEQLAAELGYALRDRRADGRGA